MLNVMEMYYDLKETMDDAAAKKIATYLGKVYDEVRDTVKSSDFNELKEIVRDLAEAQKHTETRMEELAEAQQRTEIRVGELAEAQKELAKAQKLTEIRVEELAEAQTRTEEAIQDLAGAHKSLARQVGGLSNMIGGDIEDVAYSLLFHFLPKEFGWQIGKLRRVWKDWGGKELDQIDIFAEATDPKRPDVPIWIVGEAKYNLTIKELKHFIKLIERARECLKGEVFPLCFCYRARPDVQQQAQEAGIRIVFSYGEMI